MRQPRIALIAASLGILGGQGVQAHILVERLRADGHEVVFIPINPLFPRPLQWIRRYPYVRTILNQLFYLPSLFRMRQTDIAHVFSASYFSFLLAPLPAMFLGRLLRKRVILHYHSGEAEEHLTRWGLLVHPWLRLVDQIVVPSEYLRDVFARHGYRVRVIRNVVDTSRFLYRERAQLRPILLSTRNLEPYYRVDITLEAFALLKKEFPDATLTLAGYGSQEDRLRRLAASFGSDGIRFVGRVEHPVVSELYGASDIFVNSSTLDNQPVSVLEAFAAGLPVVSTPTGDIANMVRDGETGLIIPPEDPAAMAKAVVTLLEDPGRALAIARRAKKEVERYTWGKIGPEWSVIYAGAAA